MVASAGSTGNCCSDSRPERYPAAPAKAADGCTQKQVREQVLREKPSRNRNFRYRRPDNRQREDRIGRAGYAEARGGDRETPTRPKRNLLGSHWPDRLRRGTRGDRETPIRPKRNLLRRKFVVVA